MLDTFIKLFKGKSKIDIRPSCNIQELNVLQRAEMAMQILENPMWNEAVKKIEEELIIRWKNSPIKDNELREMIFYRIEALQNINDALKGFLNNALYETQKEELCQRTL